MLQGIAVPPEDGASHTGGTQAVGLETDDAVRLQVLPDTEAAKEWDGCMAELSEPSFYQAYSWGQYRRLFGWRPLRCLLLSRDSFLGMAQCLVREFPLCRTAVVWVPGGPLLNGGCWQKFREALTEHLNQWHLYLRIEPPGLRSKEMEAQLIQAGWQRARSRLNSGKTIVVSLREEESERRRRLTGNWRHNLVRGERQDFIVERWIPSTETDDALLNLYRDMVALKGISAAMDRDSIGHMSKAFGSRFVVVAIKSRAGELLAARGGGLVGTLGYDLFAAASETGRRTYASYVALWRLLDELRDRGALSYDLGGVDPERAPGVYHFKRGVGGLLVERVGEWEWSHSTLISLAVNAWVKKRIASLA